MDRKKKDQAIENEHCVCHKVVGLFVPNRQLSFIVTGILLSFFFVFVIGFVGGQRQALAQLSQKLDQESFADHIYSSVCSLCDQPGGEESMDCEQEDQDEGGEEPITKNEEMDKAPEAATEKEYVVKSDSDTEMKGESKKSYYAQLIGFGNEKSAHQFAKRLTGQQVPVTVKERKSKTVRGKTIAWYQVVTEMFDNKEELSTLVERIAKQEKLNNVVIVPC